jgi:hypothetical protein
MHLPSTTPATPSDPAAASTPAAHRGWMRYRWALAVGALIVVLLPLQWRGGTARPDGPARWRVAARDGRPPAGSRDALLLPAHALLWQPEDTVPYECDGLTAYRQRRWWSRCPSPRRRWPPCWPPATRLQVPVVARGAGTGLSGGAMPHALGVTLSLARFNRILKLDPLARTAVVQCGVRNLAISEAAAPHGLYYAPDPSSQIACTIGGNVAENSGGVHCLKYGLTLHNVLRVRGFTPKGEPVEFGSEALDAPGLDLLALVVGSEGMLAVAPPRSPSGWCPSRSWRAASWPASTTSARPATRWPR